MANPDPPESAKCGSPGSRPERAIAPQAVVGGEPNVVCARSSPPAGEAAGGLSIASAQTDVTSALRVAGPGRPEVIERVHALLAWAIPVVGKFPRAYRFTLGDRLQQRLYGLLETLLHATYATRPDKAPLLRTANVNLEILRHELRLAFSFRLLSARQIEHASRLEQEVGRQLGGWLRSLR